MDRRHPFNHCALGAAAGRDARANAELASNHKAFADPPGLRTGRTSPPEPPRADWPRQRQTYVACPGNAAPGQSREHYRGVQSPPRLRGNLKIHLQLFTAGLAECTKDIHVTRPSYRCLKVLFGNVVRLDDLQHDPFHFHRRTPQAGATAGVPAR